MTKTKKIYQYSRQELQKCKISRLQEICKKHQVTPIGHEGRKSSYILALQQVTLSNGYPLVRKPTYGFVTDKN